MKQLITIVCCCCLLQVQAQKAHWETILKEDFSNPLDTKIWASEKMPDIAERIEVKEGKLILDTKGGATIWLRQKLPANIRISYQRKLIMAGGVNDRVSDLNQFFHAQEPPGGLQFNRKSRFEEYDSLNLYYVGMGGNYNTSTRFRKYFQGDKKILIDFADAPHLLEANKTYSIVIEVLNGLVSYTVDGVKFFEWKDPQPFPGGYFAFRSTKSRQEIDDLQIETWKD
jgi:rhamnogalacturonan endolyase